jgi:hypothetical protein
MPARRTGSRTAHPDWPSPGHAFAVDRVQHRPAQVEIFRRASRR